MRFLIVSVLFLAGGCTSLEMAAKVGARLALDGAQAAMEEKIGDMGAGIIEAAKEASDKAIASGAEYASEKAVRASNLGIRQVILRAGLDPGEFDTNDSGRFEDNELAKIEAALKGVGGWDGTIYLGLFYVLMQVLKWSGRKKLPGKLLKAFLNGGSNGNAS